MRGRLGRAALAAALVGSVVANADGAAGARPGAVGASALPVRSTVRGFKAASSLRFHTDPALLRLTKPSPVGVVVKLDYDPIASYDGTLPGLPATSPSVTGRSLPHSSAAVAAYQRYVAGVESGVLARLRRAVPSARLLYRYQFAYGGVGLTLPGNRIPDLARIDDVVAVQPSTVEHPLTEVTPFFLHAADLWPSLGGAKRAANKVIVGVIDTGIWPEHPSFEDLGLPAPPGTYACQFGDGTDPSLGPPFACTGKLIGASAFTQEYLGFIKPLSGEYCNATTRVCSARDADGHGTHTSSTAAGDANRPASIFGISRGQVSGMAPGARLIMYRVCLAQGCFTDDLVAAVNQAIADGVDVINYSISGGFSYEDPVESSFLDAYAAGISVEAAAGNTGPAAGTANHVGPWTDTVAAATSPRMFTSTLHLASSDGATLDVQGASLTAGAAGAPVVLAQQVPGNADALCRKPLLPGSANGDIVLCERGINARVEKGYNVLQGGAAGFVLYNPVEEDVETDNHWLPAVHLDVTEGENVRRFLSHHGGVTGSFPAGEAAPQQPDVLAAFSSRGPAGDFIKPDIVAPGIEVLAGDAPNHVDVVGGPPGELFQAIAGTSMASPHAAGIAALLKASHPRWTPGQIKSALMTSAVTDVVTEDHATPATPFDGGSGRIRADLADNPTLTFDASASAYAALIGDPARRIDLNLPSIDASHMPGLITTTRVGRNVSGTPQTFHVVTTEPPGSSITVTPSDFTVAAGARQTLSITIDAGGLPNGQYFGSIELDDDDPAATDVHMPVAFDRAPGAVSLANSCDSTSIAVGISTACRATVTAPAGVTTTYKLAVQPNATAAQLALSSVSPPGQQKRNGFEAQDTLSPSTSPVIERIDPGGPSFLDLGALGIHPLSGVGDETITNVGTPQYLFGGQPYTAIGLVSDGYAVIGGGGSPDVSYRPQTFPDPAQPNNVIAPLWTDLNPGAGGKVYTANVSQAGATWIVLEWSGVPIYQTQELQTFEIWIEAGATEDVGFVYGPVTGTGASTGLTVGAENSDGTSGINVTVLPATGNADTVVASGPRPGESETITYVLTGARAGSYDVVASMKSPLVPGTTVQTITIDVAP
jgi:hypothetical protein